MFKSWLLFGRAQHHMTHKMIIRSRCHLLHKFNANPPIVHCNSQRIFIYISHYYTFSLQLKDRRYTAQKEHTQKCMRIRRTTKNTEFIVIWCLFKAIVSYSIQNRYLISLTFLYSLNFSLIRSLSLVSRSTKGSKCGAIVIDSPHLHRFVDVSAHLWEYSKQKKIIYKNGVFYAV